MTFRKILYFMAILACASFAWPVTAQADTTDSINVVFARLNKTLTTGDIKDIESDLHPRFAVGVTSRPKSESYLSFLLQHRIMRSVEFNGTAIQKGDTILAGSIFEDGKGVRSEGVVAMDSDYKLLYIDFFDRLYLPGRNEPSRLIGKIPFELNDEGIILNLRLNENDRVLRFLLDTGADGMAIKKSLADSLGLNVSRRQEAQVVGGMAEMEISSGNTVILGEGITLKNQNIALFEQVGHQGTDGILGLNLAYNYIVNTDFDLKTISLFSMGDFSFDEKGQTIDITVPHGIILLPASINITGKKEVPGNFVFDTGANYHAICFEGFVRRNRLLLTGFKSLGQAATTSMGITTPVYLGKAYRFSLADGISVEDMPVTLQASTGRQIRSDEPDGSIGIRLLKHFNFTIDLLRKKIHLSSNNSEMDNELLLPE